jgi:hypothetical protein
MSLYKLDLYILDPYIDRQYIYGICNGYIIDVFSDCDIKLSCKIKWNYNDDDECYYSSVNPIIGDLAVKIYTEKLIENISKKIKYEEPVNFYLSKPLL